MRILHTADWHLGRIFQGIHLTSDQVYILDQLKSIIRESKVDLIAVSGDIYDRAVPPPEAVKLLDDTISSFIFDLKIPMIIIAGNHDSPDRLNFGSRLFAAHNLFLSGSLQFPVDPIVLSDDNGPVHFYALPYAEPSMVRELTGNQEIREHNDAMSTIINGIEINKQTRTVLCGHAFVQGADICKDSERPLCIGGTGSIDSEIFSKFTCTILGHLHRPQVVANSSIHYSGSILPYSFSETDHKKSVTLLDIDKDGKVTYEYIPLQPKHALRIVNGMMTEIIQAAAHDSKPDDYLLVRLQDKEPILDAIGKLRNVYPNVLLIERPGLESTISDLYETRVDHRKLSDEDLFAAFVSQTTGSTLTDAQAEFFLSIVEKVHRKEREASE